MHESQAAAPPVTQPAWAGLCLACLVLPWISPLTSGPSASVVPWLVSAACTTLLWLATGTLRVPSLVLASFAILLAAVIARPGGLSPETASLAGGCLVIVACAGIAGGPGPREGLADGVAAAWLAAACISSLFALAQYFGWADRLAPFVTVPSVPEAYANLRQRNQFASLAAIGMAALFWFSGRGMAWRLALPAAMLLATASAATASRTGALQMVAIAGLVLVWAGPPRSRQLAVCGAALAAYLVASFALPVLQEWATGVPGNSVFDRFVTDLGCSSRQVLWSNVLDLIAARPWLGWGWGELDYAHLSHAYPGARFCDVLDNAHNLPLHLAVELGVPVALVLCGALAWLVLRGAPWRERDPVRQLAWSVLALILMHSLVEYPLWYGPFQMAFGLALGLLAPAFAATWAGRARARVASWSFAALFGAALIFAAWDYHRVSQIYLAPEARGAAWRDDTLDKIRPSWLFGNQARFAELTMTPLTQANAVAQYEMAGRLLHYSPEPRVIEKRLESAQLLGRDEEVTQLLARFRAAFPAEAQAWLQTHGAPASGAP